MESKTCSTCGETKALDGFRKGRNQCSECDRKWQRIYRQANRAKLRSKAREYRKTNRKKINRLQKEYRQTNREKVRTNENRYRQANREKIRSQQEKFRLIHREQLKEYRRENKEEIKESRLRSRYGLTSNDIQRILDKQDHRCKICLAEFNDEVRHNVDHCHETDEFRGLLCVCCNLGLGRFKDNINRLKQAIIYLEPR